MAFPIIAAISLAGAALKAMGSMAQASGQRKLGEAQIASSEWQSLPDRSKVPLTADQQRVANSLGQPYTSFDMGGANPDSQKMLLAQRLANSMAKIKGIGPPGTAAASSMAQKNPFV